MGINQHQDYENRRIALFFTSLDVGGTPRVMLRLMDGFINAGFMVDAVVVRAFGSFRNKIPAGVNLVDLGAGRTLIQSRLLFNICAKTSLMLFSRR